MNETRDARLLIVDDEEPVRTVLRRWLEADGYSCETASSAQEGWRRLLHKPFDLVISDIRMPDESGVEFLTRIRRHFGPEISVMLATGVSEPDTAYEALQLGASHYLVKPFERHEVLIAVASALGRRRDGLQSERRHELLTDEVRRRDEEIALRLVWAAECRDTDTGHHVRRIGLSVRELAIHLGWSRSEAEDLRLAAAMHDIGKIGIPDNILLKPGPLDAEEIRVMRAHTEQGAMILRGSSSPLLQLAQDIALHHHERWDGAGYPSGLAGTAIPEAARIVTVVDVYDALTRDRPYRPAYSEEEALAIMRRSRGKTFDPAILEVFFRILPEIQRIPQMHRSVDDEGVDRCA